MAIIIGYLLKAKGFKAPFRGLVNMVKLLIRFLLWHVCAVLIFFIIATTITNVFSKPVVPSDAEYEYRECLCGETHRVRKSYYNTPSDTE